MKNILVTGYSGQLGYDVARELSNREYTPLIPTKDEMNLLNQQQIKEYILNSKCDAIIHCAAYTQVDKAEENENNCIAINALSTKIISECAKYLDVPMIYISTDYIFDGQKSGEYNEYDIPNPINVYGKSKYIGETYIKEILEKYYIVRISWVFGINGNNFIKTMLKLSESKNSLNIINDQIGSPTYTKDLSRLLVDMLESDKYGVYNATNSQFCTWYEFAKYIFKISNKEITINPIKTNEYKTLAQRPLNSKLNKDKLLENGFDPLRDWKDAVKDYINELKK